MAFNLNVKAQTLYFPPITGNTWDTINPSTLNWCNARIDSLFQFLDSKNTKAFIVLKDGKIVLEKYFGTHSQNSVWYWASAGKTVTSFLVGIAQQENFLKITDTTSKYLGPGWTNCLPTQENKITIRNQLTMTSGLDDGVPDVYCTYDSCLVYKSDAGTRWAYHNAPYTLLDSVIESATNTSLNVYAQQKLKTPTGISGLFVKSGFNNVFVSNARSMARFGLLVLNKGNWNGNQVLTDTNYFNQMVNTSQNLNQSYGYLWWLNGKSSFRLPQTQLVFTGPLMPNAPSDMFAALGKNGQIINVIPSQNLVWIRMGDAPDSSEVPFLLDNDIWQYFNKLNCTATQTSQFKNNSYTDVYPNPFIEKLHLKTSLTISNLQLLDLQGRLLQKIKYDTNDQSIILNDIQNGIYFLNIIYSNGINEFKKIIRNQ